MIDSKLSDPTVTFASKDEKPELPPQRTESRQALEMPSPASLSGIGTDPTTEEVAALAYQFWIERGSPHGSHEEDWHRAEQELRSRQMSAKRATA